ncbi:MAG TPA: DNA-directed RNA polymerase subunit alpha, partial [Anaerolineales bacterium]|nr:DNA-directed RNA polymerase subunit alpha [Anaerolineales bacterium]
MLHPIYLPDHVEVEDQGSSAATFTIHPYHPGYGPTVANALRRVLLSSLPGAAITSVKIEGVDHEFTTLPGIKEDIVSLVMNLKKIRLKSLSEQPVEIRLIVSGEKVVTAGDFDTPPDITIVNPEQVVATLTDSQSKIELRCMVEQGRGYLPTEERRDDSRPIGTIAIDAVFTPVQRVSFKIENVRVGQDTNYHKLHLMIATDGTITPEAALRQAASILTDHFKDLTGDLSARFTAQRPQDVSAPIETVEIKEPENTLSLLQLPSRVHNALERVGITT